MIYISLSNELTISLIVVPSLTDFSLSRWWTSSGISTMSFFTSFLMSFYYINEYIKILEYRNIKIVLGVI